MMLYTLAEYDTECDGDEEAWSAELLGRAGGRWSPVLARGITPEGRRLRRWSLRRELPVKETA